MLIEMVSTISAWAIPFLLFAIPAVAFCRRVNVYEAFIEGAQEGFETAVRIIPYMVAMLVAISIFRASGALDLFARAIAPIMQVFGVPPEVLPMAVMRPLSGSGALGFATELIKVHGPDSLIGRMASVMQGTTDTTFYVLTVYFGSVGVKKYRHALALGLIADLSGLIASIYICRKLFSL
jgi:spore maturation protein B